ncbi:restriction endonuclease subunit S [uncultured Maribacter sp.]|uniref:restriction endonuclease subunit S n=1 Tax=uncultured Maribacter sp. TaxID=431308 RepID=UPI002624EB71|nr:restriction endonuclease subunit S [uncultured Maribacter sp.]
MVEVENKVQRYDTYKDSGVKWLGEIPEHWQIERGKWLFKKNERPIRKEDKIITCFRDGEVTLRSNRKNSGFTVALKEHGYQGIRKGDLVIHVMDAFAGAIGVSDSDGKSTPVYSACTERFPETINQYYYSYFLRSLALNGIILALAKGIRERSTDFRFKDFGELLLSFPPLPEQTKIAQFLDDKTTKIEDAIAIKKQQINLLKERKQILIHKAVTRGLDDSVTLKDSGVEWIGEIPEHWEVKKIKYLVDEVNIRSTTGEEELLSLSKYKGVIPKSSLEERAGQANSLIGYKKVFENCLVINKMQAVNGLIDVSKLEGITSPDYSVYKSKDSKILDINYLNSLVNQIEYLAEFKKRVTGVMDGFIRLYTDDLYDIKIHLPPLSEQKEISAYIETASRKIETAIGLKQQEIDRLKEYKSSLINGVVTGKVRVC